MTKIRHTFHLLLLALMLSGCSWSVDTDLAELSVEKFHNSYNKGSFRTIYINASPAFREFITEDKFTLVLEKLRASLGHHKSSNLINWSAKSSFREGTTITLIYGSTYTKYDKVREVFTFKVQDGLAQLYNFNVSSEGFSKNKASSQTEI